MSFRAVTWALDEVRGLTATQKLILISLAEFANDDDETWRAREAIAMRAECSLSAVEKTIRLFRDLGLLTMAARYAWCEREESVCADRGFHKHRSGSTYKLNLQVKLVAVPKRKVGLNESIKQEDRPTQSTPVKSTGVAETAKSQGKSHNHKIYGYESTPVKNGVPHPHPGEDILSINLHRTPNQTKPALAQPLDTASGPGLVRSGSVESLDLKAAALLIRKCLPDPMHIIDAQLAPGVGQMLQERLDAGWSPMQIRAAMDQPLPTQVSRLGALVAKRLKTNVLPELAPEALRKEALGRVGVIQPVDDEPAIDPRFSAACEHIRLENPDLSHRKVAELAYAQIQESQEALP